MGAVERYQPHAIERLDNATVKGIANTDLVPKKLRGNVPAIIATILKGRALGLDDMHALSAINFIEGNPTLGAETMVMLARRRGHSIRVSAKSDAVTVVGKRADNGDTFEATWTLDDAKAAGLLGKDNWKKYPRQMLAWRASAEVCRILFPDVLAGVSHTPEELERTPEEQVVEAIGEVGPPPDTHAPDDTIRTDEPVVEGHAVLVEEPEGEPVAAEASPSADTRSVAPEALSPGEPGSPSDTPETDRGEASAEAATSESTGGRTPPSPGAAEPQASIFEQMAATATARKHKDPTA